LLNNIKTRLVMWYI